MKTKLLKKWRWLYKFCRMKSKFFTQASAYRSSFGDLFFCLYIKHHHLYEAIKLECDILGVKPLWIWRENHPFHSKYAPSCRLRVKKFVCDFDFASMYMTQIRPIHFIEVDHVSGLCSLCDSGYIHHSGGLEELSTLYGNDE